MNYEDLHLVYNRHRYELPRIKKPKAKPTAQPEVTKVEIPQVVMQPPMEQPVVLRMEKPYDPYEEIMQETVELYSAPPRRMDPQLRTGLEMAAGALFGRWLSGQAPFQKEYVGDPNQHISDRN
jgi:hypothetical protein